jgi:hypothetical protein
MTHIKGFVLFVLFTEFVLISTCGQLCRIFYYISVLKIVCWQISLAQNKVILSTSTNKGNRSITWKGDTGGRIRTAPRLWSLLVDGALNRTIFIWKLDFNMKQIGIWIGIGLLDSTKKMDNLLFKIKWSIFKLKSLYKQSRNFYCYVKSC